MAAASRTQFQQAGVIPYRRHNGDVEILLVTSSRGQRWVIPKGHIDEGMTAAEAARLEAHEEAGITGALTDEPVGRYRYQKWGGDYRVAVFLMNVKRQRQTWPEAAVRQREWMTPQQAIASIKEPRLKELIKQASRELETVNK